MKFETTQTDVVVTGEIQTNKVGIDINNIDFITTILSTNLYSKPIESLLREAISNAWDSHVEAGNTDPIILELFKDVENDYYCRIQDFGVGISLERFNNIYRNVGSSTKRNDNTAIGGYGLGRFSSLSYTNTVYITSVYTGIEYQYLMYKDGNSINIDLLFDKPTDARNGVEIKIKLNGYSDVTKFVTAIKSQLLYFENLYFVNNTNISNYKQDDINNILIKKYENFYVNSFNDGYMDILYGKVVYPIRMDALHKKYDNFVKYLPISLKFEIGELRVAPNREELTYSTDVINKIEDKLDAAILELTLINKSHVTKDFDRINKYVTAIESSSYFSLLVVDGITKVECRKIVDNTDFTLNGVNYNDKQFAAIYDIILNCRVLSSHHAIRNGKMTNVNCNYALKDVKHAFTKTYLVNISKCNNTTKQYMRETFATSSLLLYDVINYKRLYRSYSNEVQLRYGNFSKDSYIIFKIIIKNFLKNFLKIPTFGNSNVPNSYIEDLKQQRKQKKIDNIVSTTETINITYFSDFENAVTNTKNVTIEHLKKYYNRRVVYSDKADFRTKAFYVLFSKNKNIQFIQIAPTKQKYVKDLANFIFIDDFINVNYVEIRRLATAMYINNTITNLQRCYTKVDIFRNISKNLADDINTLTNYVNKYRFNGIGVTNRLADQVLKICTQANKFDIPIKTICDVTANKLSKISFVLDNNSHYYNLQINDVMLDYILARKIIRPDLKSVQKMKLNLKNRLNESN